VSTPFSPVRLYEPIPGDRADFWRSLLSTHGDVAPALLEPGTRAWLLLSYDVNKYVLSQDRFFSRDPRQWREMADGTIGPDSGIRAAWQKRDTALFSDGEEHRRFSGALLKAFAELSEQHMFANIRTVAQHLIDDFVHEGHADLIADYTQPLPLMVMGRLFGLTSPQMSQIVEQTTRTWDGDPEAATAMGRLLFQVTVDARQSPDNPHLPALLLKQGLTETETAEQLGLLLSAGVDPVAHATGMALRELLSDPDLAASRPIMRVSETVNLILARHTPLETMVARYPLHDVRLGHYDIRAGDCLLAGFASASEDLYAGLSLESIAMNRAHLTFGVGAHRCPRYGQNLAQGMAETAISLLLERLPDLRPATPPEEHRWLSNVNLRGLVDLPVRFTPERPAPRANVPRPSAYQDTSPPPTAPRRLRGFLSMFGFRN